MRKLIIIYHLSFNNLFKVYSTIEHDENKLNKNHTDLLVDEEIGLIETFYEIQSKHYGVVQL